MKVLATLKNREFEISGHILKIFLLVIILIHDAGNVTGQQKYTFGTFFEESADLIKQPAKWNACDWAKFGVIALGTYSLMYADESVRDFVMEDRNYLESIPIIFGTIYGEGFTPVVLGGALLIHGTSTDNIKNTELGFEIIQAAFYATAINGLGKITFGRERPFKDNGAFSFYPLSFRGNEFMSLGSGHTTIAFATSTVLSEHTDNGFLKGLCFLPAFITAFSRIYKDMHWTSDVFLGAATGFFVAKFFTELHKKQNSNPDPVHGNYINLIIPF